MTRCITLNDITYKNKWYAIDTKIDVDDRDVNKLVKIGAIKVNEPAKTKINVIENPIAEKEPKKAKKKYNKKEDELGW